MSKFQYTSFLFVLLLLLCGAGVYFFEISYWWLLVIVLVYLSFLVAGSALIRWNFYLRSVHSLFDSPKYSHTQPGSRAIALTFDDGPAAYTAEILDVLQAEGVTATFFIIGKHVEGKEHLVMRMQREGHTIGSHSFYHGFNFDWQSASRMQQEIQQANEAISKVTGEEVKLFRPPYGVTNPNLAKAIRRSGVISVGWNLRSVDTVAREEDRLLKKIWNNIEPGSIILLHDSCAITARILPLLLEEIKKRGFEPVAL